VLLLLLLLLSSSFVPVSLLLREEPANPKCFSGEQKDFTCFWEEDEERAGHVGQYSFTYAYQ